MGDDGLQWLSKADWKHLQIINLSTLALYRLQLLHEQGLQPRPQLQLARPFTNRHRYSAFDPARNKVAFRGLMRLLLGDYKQLRITCLMRNKVIRYGELDEAEYLPDV